LLLVGPEGYAGHEFELWCVAFAGQMEEQPLHSLILKETKILAAFDHSGHAIGSKEYNRRNMFGLVMMI
jgi:hypothetical protein